MTTNVAGDGAREYHTAQTHYLRKDINSSHAGLTVDVGALPDGAVVLRSYLATKTPFNGVGNTVNVGTAAAPTAFVAAGGIGAAGIVPSTLPLTAPQSFVTSSLKVQAVVTSTGATAGDASIIIEYSANLS